MEFNSFMNEILAGERSQTYPAIMLNATNEGVRFHCTYNVFGMTRTMNHFATDAILTTEYR